jgi:hypothetical protein
LTNRLPARTIHRALTVFYPSRPNLGPLYKGEHCYAERFYLVRQSDAYLLNRDADIAAEIDRVRDVIAILMNIFAPPEARH